jgi:ATP-dependent DNA ligase
MGLEGIVSKRLDSRYRSGRSKDWLKFKNPEAPAVKRVRRRRIGGDDADIIQTRARTTRRKERSVDLGRCELR